MTHIDPDELRRAAELMTAAGVDLVIDLPTGGSCSLSADDLVHHCTDPEGFYAKAAGVPRRTLEHWQAWMSCCGRCTGTTRKGLRCGNGTEMREAHEFVPGLTDRCEHHRDLGVTEAGG